MTVEEQIAKYILAQYGLEVVELFRAELTNIGLPSKYPSGVDIELYNSVEADVDKEFNVVINMAPQWFWVVKGRRSRKQKPSIKPPPIAPILTWVKEKRKFQLFRLKTTKAGKKGQFLSFNQTAYIIRNAIWKNGIQPRNFVKPAAKEAEDLYNKKFANQLFELFAEGAKLQFNKVRIRKTKTFKIVKIS